MRKELWKILCSICIMLTLLAGCSSEDKETPKEINPEYTSFMEENNLKDVNFLEPYLGFHTIEYTNSFVMKDSDGIITVQQFAASENDTVCIDAYALYYPISEYNTEEKEAFDTSMRQSFSEIEAFDFASITSTIGEEYYEIIICLHHLNEYDNYLAAAEAGYYSTIPAEDTLIGYKISTSALLEEGYIAKYIEEVQ